MCNRFAIDIPCPTDLTVCHNSHVMDDQGNTVSVSKKCATEQMCSGQVGCRQTPGSANQTVRLIFPPSFTATVILFS